jgi:hypothetical protein
MTDAFLDQMAEDQAALVATSDRSPVSRLLAQLAVLTERIAKGETLLATLKQQAQTILTRDLPDALKALGVQAVTLDDGTVVKMVEMVQTNISAERRVAAHAWLEAHGHGGVIKREASLTLPKGDEGASMVRELAKVAATLGVPLDVSENVHPQTLKALVREILAQETGQTPVEQRLPRETFGVFVVEMAEIKRDKKTQKKSAR